MKELPNSITKRVLWRYVNKKIDRVIHHYHVFSIISILFDEILIDLKLGKELKIFNFGSLTVKKLPPRKYYNIHDKIVRVSKPHNILRFNLSPKLRKELKKQLDVSVFERSC